MLPRVTGRAAKQLQLGAGGARMFLPKMLKLDSEHIESRAAGIANVGYMVGSRFYFRRSHMIQDFLCSDTETPRLNQDIVVRGSKSINVQKCLILLTTACV